MFYIQKSFKTQTKLQKGFHKQKYVIYQTILQLIFLLSFKSSIKLTNQESPTNVSYIFYFFIID